VGRTALVQAPVAVECEHIDAVRVTSRSRGLAGEAAAERLPVMPARPVPIAIAKLSIVVDGEELALSAIAPRRDGRAPHERAAQ